MANSNCLIGMRCPSCKQEDRFSIIGSSVFEMYDDGSEGHGDIEYDETAFCACPNCDWEGTIGDAKALTDEEKERLVRAVMQRCYDDFKWMRDVVEAHVEHTCDLQTYREFFEEEDGDD
jgi:hypothetical protein